MTDIQTVSVEKGGVLFKEGEDAENIYIITKGRLMGITKGSNRVVPMVVGDEEDIIGEESLFDGKHQYTAVAIEDSELTLIPSKDINEFFESVPEWMESLMKVLSDRLRHTQGLIRENNLTDSLLTGGRDLTPEEETFFLSIVKDSQ